VAQPVVGVGVSRFGTSFGGGLALSFSDMLRNHQLVTAFQVNSGLGRSTSVKDIGAQVGYFNQAHRWNWGLVGGQVPYLSSGFQSTLSQRPNGDVIQTDQLFVFRQDRAQRVGRHRVSVQSRLACRASGRRQPDLLRSDRHDAVVFANHRRRLRGLDRDDVDR
jgi:hypothetical protein